MTLDIRRSLPAVVLLLNDLTHFTLDLTAPDELAFTSFDRLHAPRVVSLAAAQTLTRRRPGAVHLTLASLRARNATSPAALAVVGRVFSEHKLIFTDGFPSGSLPSGLELSVGRAR